MPEEYPPDAGMSLFGAAGASFDLAGGTTGMFRQYKFTRSIPEEYTPETGTTLLGAIGAQFNWTGGTTENPRH
jgi:hypothetical protein